MEILTFWQNIPLQIDPVIFSIGNLSIRWYSLGYLLALLTIYFFLKRQLKSQKKPFITLDKLENILLIGFFGALLGGRIGYTIFYSWPDFLNDPFSIFWPFDQNGNFVGLYGMSFHGGLIGALLAGWLICRKYKISFLEVLNFIIPVFPLGYFWGRLGNFFNGELYGRITESGIGMHFPDQPALLRHPSQIYEAIGEGLILFFILKYFSRKQYWSDKIFPLFLLFYGIIRFLIEFLREPDPQLGLIVWQLTMGQLLSLVMIFTGSLILFLQNKSGTYSDSDS